MTSFSFQHIAWQTMEITFLYLLLSFHLNKEKKTNTKYSEPSCATLEIVSLDYWLIEDNIFITRTLLLKHPNNYLLYYECHMITIICVYMCLSNNNGHPSVHCVSVKTISLFVLSIYSNIWYMVLWPRWMCQDWTDDEQVGLQLKQEKWFTCIIHLSQSIYYEKKVETRMGNDLTNISKVNNHL